MTINALILCILKIISVSNGIAERLNTAEIVADSAAFILASYGSSLTFATYLLDFRSACLRVAYLHINVHF